MEKPEGLLLHPAHAEMVNSDRIVHQGPCIVTGFSVSGDGAAGEADLYDGTNTEGSHKCKVTVLDSTTFAWDLTHPVDFDHGIYIAVNADTTYVTVCYIPESRKAFI